MALAAERQDVAASGPESIFATYVGNGEQRKAQPVLPSIPGRSSEVVSWRPVQQRGHDTLRVFDMKRSWVIIPHLDIQQLVSRLSHDWARHVSYWEIGALIVCSSNCAPPLFYTYVCITTIVVLKEFAPLTLLHLPRGR